MSNMSNVPNLDFTDTTIERVQHFIKQQESRGVSALRIAGNAAKPKLWLVKDSDLMDGDIKFQVADFDVFIDPTSAEALDGMVVDFVQDVMQAGFRLFYPSPTWDDDPIAQKVQDVIDKEINPGVASHGGRVSLMKRIDDTVHIALGGGCQGCGAADVNLKQVIEVAIKKAAPEIKYVFDVTDHASGENPYYTKDDMGGQSAL